MIITADEICQQIVLEAMAEQSLEAIQYLFMDDEDSEVIFSCESCSKDLIYEYDIHLDASGECYLCNECYISFLEGGW